MRWRADKREWKLKFAWMPVKIGDIYVWLENYWSSYRGQYEQVATDDDFKRGFHYEN